MTYNLKGEHAGGWTEERFQTAKGLWIEGKSATEIAKALNCGISRNGVIGKLHRAGVVREAPKHGHGNRATKTSGGMKAVRIAPRPRPAPQIKPPKPQPVPFVELTATATLEQLCSHMCRWPLGEPEEPSFGFCGRLTGKREDGSARSYCVAHEHIAYRPTGTEDDLVKSLRRAVG